MSEQNYTSSEPASNSGSIWWPDRTGLGMGELRSNASSNQSHYPPQIETGQLNPTLCRFCRVFFDTWEAATSIILNGDCDVLKTPHFETWDELDTSARWGCHVCGQFTRLIRLDNQYGIDHPESTFTLKGIMTLYHPHSLALSETPTHWGLTLKISGELAGEFGDEELDVFLVPVEEVARHCSINTLIFEHSSQLEQPAIEDIERSLIVARSWLHDCQTNHDACKPRNKDKKPTRLVKINDNKVRLYIVRQGDGRLRYATLSHCWGKKSFICLLRHNFLGFTNEIPQVALSKTFSDAIQVARSLGFEYIWIDSLCIIQDDPRDWEMESGIMADIYGSSCLNIAATASPDGKKGCFFDRDPVYIQGGQVELEMNGIRRAYRFWDGKLFAHNLEGDNAPLLARAWVLQECLLAPRTLHFTTSQCFWECGTKFSCEAFPDHIPQTFYSNEYEFPTTKLGEKWEFIVDRYCYSSLTKSSDKLVALAGIARKFGEITGDDYFAGIWRKSFEIGLCWSTYFSQLPSISNSLTEPRSGTIFPSWSWAAIDGVLQIDPTVSSTSKLKVRYIEIVHIHVVPDGPDPFGNIKEAKLVIKSTFMVRASKTPDFRMSIRGLSIPKGVLWDLPENVEDEFMVVIIGIFSDFRVDSRFRHLEGLILGPTHKLKGEYRRLGRYQLYQHDTSVSLEDVRSKLLDDLFELRDFSHLPTEEEYISTGVTEAGVKWYEISIV